MVTCCPHVKNLNNFGMGALHLPVVMGPTDPRAPPAHMPLNWPGGAGERGLAWNNEIGPALVVGDILL